MLRRLWSSIRSAVGRKSLERDMDDEMRFHIEAYEKDLIHAGVSPEEAHRRARVEFGAIQRVKEECRESKGLSLFDEIIRNISYSLRLLRRSPGFTASVVLTLALCIGANTAIFSVVDAILFRPLPYPEPDRLGEVTRQIFRGGDMVANQTNQNGFAWETLKNGSSYELAASMSSGGVNLGVDNRAVYVQPQLVTAGYFHVLGVPMTFGREFRAEEDTQGGAAVVILGYGFWKRFFHGDPAIVGRTILLRGEPHIVVGVANEAFRPVVDASLWLPLRPSLTGSGAGTNYNFTLRVKPEANWAQVQTEIQAKGVAIFEHMKIPKDVSGRFLVMPFQSQYKAAWRNNLLIVWAAVGCVLLIGCVNVASLMLARGQSRQREMGTRIALGCGAGSLFRQLTTEATVIGLLGGATGLGLGYLAIALFERIAADYGIWQELKLDARVFLGTALLALLTSFLFGVAPAIQAVRTDVRNTLLEGGTYGVAGNRSHWLRRILVTAEVALGLFLLVGAGLLVRTLIHLQNLSPGFDGANVLAASASLQDTRYKTADRVNQLFRDSLDRIRTIPGVEGAAVGLHLPYQRWLNNGIKIPGREPRQVMTTSNYVTPGYFDVLRIPVRAGRVIDERDTATSEPVAVINETFARTLLQDQDPLASYIESGSEKVRIIGIVSDLQQRPGLKGTGPLDREAQMYVPSTQLKDQGVQLTHTWFSPSWVVRATGPRAQTVKEIEQAVATIDPMLPIASFQSMVDQRDKALGGHRLITYLLGSLAILALLLTIVGIYGLIAHSVIERTREFGIRISLGASLSEVIRAAAIPGVILSIAGTGIGAALAAAGVRVMKGVLYGVQPFDPPTFLIAAIGLLAVSIIASLVPAVGLIRLDPARVLRQD